MLGRRLCQGVVALGGEDMLGEEEAMMRRKGLCWGRGGDAKGKGGNGKGGGDMLRERL